MPYGQQSPLPYGQQPYGAPPQEHPQGTMILIFGILGIFITIFAPIAWYVGNKAKKEIQASGIQYSNEQNISIGRMLGKIFTIIAIVSIAVTIVILIVVFGIAASQSGG
jgi:small-conductance mechanosensitive channel